MAFMISCNSLQRNIESSINYDAIPGHLKKQIHKIMDEWFCDWRITKIRLFGIFTSFQSYVDGSSLEAINIVMD